MADPHPMNRVIDRTPNEVAEALARGEVLLVDVREPHELMAVRIDGAVNVPLSRFDPAAIPDPAGRRVVFLCAAGVRSAQACEISQMLGKPYREHVAGGVKAWAMAGLPFERG